MFQNLKNNFISQHRNMFSCLPIGFDNPYETLILQIYINRICPYRCSYCYVRCTENERWGSFFCDEEIDTIIETIQNSDFKNIGFVILGGEPTVQPNFENILIKFLNLKNKNSVIDILSNSYKSLDEQKSIFLKLKDYSSRIIWEFTYHSYLHLNNNNFLDKVLFIKDNYADIAVSVMLSKNKQDIPYIKDIILKLLKNNILVQPTFIIDPINDHLKPDYENLFKEYSFLDLIPRKLEFVDKDGNKFYFNDYDIQRYNLTSFTGWFCENNVWCINNDGYIYRTCDVKYHGSAFDKDYFRKIEYNPYDKCSLPYCQCTGLMTYNKFKFYHDHDIRSRK